MFWTGVFKGLDSAGKDVDDGEEEPEREEDFDFDFGLLKVFEGLTIFVEDVDGVEEVLDELVFGGGLSGEFLEVLGAGFLEGLFFVAVQGIFAHFLLGIVFEPRVRDGLHLAQSHKRARMKVGNDF